MVRRFNKMRQINNFISLYARAAHTPHCPPVSNKFIRQTKYIQSAESNSWPNARPLIDLFVSLSVICESSEAAEMQLLPWCYVLDAVRVSSAADQRTAPNRTGGN